MPQASAEAQRIGRRCVITGAGRGIGEAIAAAMSKEGASLALVSRTKSELEEARAFAAFSHGS